MALPTLKTTQLQSGFKMSSQMFLKLSVEMGTGTFKMAAGGSLDIFKIATKINLCFQLTSWKSNIFCLTWQNYDASGSHSYKGNRPNFFYVAFGVQLVSLQRLPAASQGHLTKNNSLWSELGASKTQNSFENLRRNWHRGTFFVDWNKNKSTFILRSCFQSFLVWIVTLASDANPISPLLGALVC